MNRFLGLLLGVALLPSTTRGDEGGKAKKNPWDPVVGHWKVTYEDMVLGEVSGMADITAEGKVTVKVKNPKTGRIHTLNSKSVVHTNDTLRMILEGESPSPDSVDPPPDKFGNAPAEPLFKPVDPKKLPRLELGPAETKLTVKLDRFTGETRVKSGEIPDVQQVELEFPLSSSPPQDEPVRPPTKLEGNWMFRADPVSWRDGQGGGRVGIFRRQKENLNLAHQTGIEVWTREAPPAQIQLFAQTARDLKKIERLYLGIPTVVEVVFDDPQEKPVSKIKVTFGGTTLELKTYRDPNDFRRSLSEPFVPGADPRKRTAESGPAVDPEPFKFDNPFPP